MKSIVILLLIAICLGVCTCSYNHTIVKHFSGSGFRGCSYGCPRDGHEDFLCSNSPNWKNGTFVTYIPTNLRNKVLVNVTVELEATFSCSGKTSSTPISLYLNNHLIDSNYGTGDGLCTCGSCGKNITFTNNINSYGLLLGTSELAFRFIIQHNVACFYRANIITVFEDPAPFKSTNVLLLPPSKTSSTCPNGIYAGYYRDRYFADNTVRFKSPLPNSVTPIAVNVKIYSSIMQSDSDTMNVYFNSVRLGTIAIPSTLGFNRCTSSRSGFEVFSKMFMAGFPDYDKNGNNSISVRNNRSFYMGPIEVSFVYQ